MTSNINSTPDYFQFLGSRLPGFPSHGDKDAKDADANGGTDLAALLAILGGDTSSLEGVGGASTHGVKSTKSTKGAPSAEGSKYTRDAATSHLPPPRAPRTAAGPNTAAAYASLADELQGAHTNAAASTMANPEVQAADAKPWRTSMDATPEEAATQMTGKVSGMLDGIQTFQGDMLREFMALRVKNGSQGLKELGELSDLATDIQGSQLKEQEAKSREADKEAHKAAAKAAKMGIFSKILQVAMLIVTAILAVCTFGVGLPLLAIAAAAAIAFVVAGAAKGAKNGNGFDAWGGLDVAGSGAAGVMMALGVGAAIMAIRTAAKTAATNVADGVSKQLSSAVVKAAEQSGTKATLNTGGKFTADDGSKVASKEAMKTLERAGFKMLDVTSAKEAHAAGKEVSKSEAVGLAKTMSHDVIDVAGDMTMGNLMISLNRQLAKQNAKDISKMTAKQKAADFAVLFKGQFMQNMGNMGKNIGTGTMGKIIGEDFGSQMMRMGLVLGGLQGGAALGQGIMQYQTTMHQTNAEESQAIIKLLNSTVEMLNGQYGTLQDTMQNISESRSKAIDAIQSMLKSDQQVNTMIANNYVSR